MSEMLDRVIEEIETQFCGEISKFRVESLARAVVAAIDPEGIEAKARATAIEECAKIADGYMHGSDFVTERGIAADIRGLLKLPKFVPGGE